MMSPMMGTRQPVGALDFWGSVAQLRHQLGQQLKAKNSRNIEGNALPSNNEVNRGLG
jgi:hypothetical protein